MFKFAASSLTIALALASFGAHAAAPTFTDPGIVPTSGLLDTPLTANSKATPSDKSTQPVEHRLDIVESPTTCGGEPAPRMLPSDGYSTLCVNGALRFINDNDTYAYSLKVYSTVNGKRKINAEMSAVNTFGRPVVLQSGQDTSYLKSVSVEKDDKTGETKTTMKSDVLHSGIFATLDPRAKLKDGSILVNVDFDYSELLSLENVTTPDGLTIQTPSVRGTNQQSEVRLSPGKTIKLTGFNEGSDGKDKVELTVELSAQPLHK